ncbi:MAG: glycosyltransferase family 39 protein [Thermoflexales bacterium]|nr:glycosyltransferase family 39 protein [Thermoflexales bacterium]
MRERLAHLVQRPAVVLSITLLGFALRLPLNDQIPPRWDEGWSVAHALLDLGELLRITAADVHPPAYYLLLKGWLWLGGVDLFAARYLSVVLGTLAIPLTYVAARVWLNESRGAVWAALVMAWLPLAVYYSAVVRMYALALPLVALATYTAGRLMQHRRAEIALGASAAGAMLTLYHAGWALAALGLTTLGRALLQRDGQALRQLASGVGVALALFLPWAGYALPQLLERARVEQSRNIGQQIPLDYFVQLGVRDLTLSQTLGEAGVLALGSVIVGGSALALFQRRSPALLVMPLIAIALTLLGVAFGARQWAYNARMLTGAAPALALALGWALSRWSGAHPALSALAALGLAAIHAPISSGLVYTKSLEVFDPYDPHQYRARIAPAAKPNDLVVFNVLSPAGFYALDRSPSDPSWSYALTWDPVIEPRDLWEARLRGRVTRHGRVWLVLYRGLAGQNGHLRGWMDSHLFPADAAWSEEGVFFGLYGARQPTHTRTDPGWDWGDIRLVQAQTVEHLPAGSVLPVALTWVAQVPPVADDKIFVHALAPDGRLIAQHDAQPLNDLRPMTSWTVGEPVHDRHGLALPDNYRGALTLLVGRYDPNTGQRRPTRFGAGEVKLGSVVVDD